MTEPKWPEAAAPAPAPAPKKAPPPAPTPAPKKRADDDDNKRGKRVEGKATLRGQPGDPNHVDETVYGQPVDTPKDTEEELIRRRYNGGMTYDEWVTAMHAIGADPEAYNKPNDQQQPVNDDPTQPGADAARKHPGKTHRLADVEE